MGKILISGGATKAAPAKKKAATKPKSLLDMTGKPTGLALKNAEPSIEVFYFDGSTDSARNIGDRLNADTIKIDITDDTLYLEGVGGGNDIEVYKNNFLVVEYENSDRDYIEDHNTYDTEAQVLMHYALLK